MKYIGENAIKKLISLIKGDLATKQDSIAATGVLERDTTGVINGVETVGATLVETQEATLVDVPNGLLKGDGTTISAAVAGTDYVNSSQAIRYDAAQTLTDAQKTQARGNINAAPGGFGLGDAIVYAPENSEGASDANLIDATGFYLAIANAIGGWNYVFHMQYPSDAALQFSSFVKDTTYRIRKKINGVWQPWEWVNPPMFLGDEYRTTERYLNKPVYKKLLLFTGAMTEGYSSMAHNIANIAHVVGCYAELLDGSTTVSTPILDGNDMIIFSATESTIRKTSVRDYSAYSARVLMSYTKTME